MIQALRRSRWTGPALWAAALLIITSWPNPDVPDVGRGDKLVHALMYAPLALLIARAAPSVTHRPARALALVGGVALFAAVDEWHQRLIPGRSASVGDWAADVVGASGGLLLAAVRTRRARRTA